MIRIAVSRSALSRRVRSAAAACGFIVAAVAATPASAQYQSQNLFNFGTFGSSGPIPREVVTFPGNYRPGTIIVNTSEYRLYLITGNGQAIRYGVGVGREGFGWHGVHRIVAKREWPDWTPPAQMLRRRPDLPRHMEGGEANPLGARAMYIGGTLYRIHGSNEPESIGHAVSSGCIRMVNEDVIDLYNRVPIGATVIVR